MGDDAMRGAMTLGEMRSIGRDLIRVTATQVLGQILIIGHLRGTITREQAVGADPGGNRGEAFDRSVDRTAALAALYAEMVAALGADFVIEAVAEGLVAAARRDLADRVRGN